MGWLITLPGIGFPQALVVSSNADFSTFDTHFTFAQTLYIRVQPSQIDFTTIQKNRFTLEPETDGADFEVEGRLVNHWDGTFTGSIDLSTLNHTFSQWKLEVKLEDQRNNRFEESLLITIAEESADQTIGDMIIEGTLQNVSGNSIRVSGQTFFVDEETEIYKNGNPYSFQDVEVKLQSVKLYAQSRSDGTLWVKRIDLLDEGSVSIEYEGRIAVIGNNRFFMSGVWILVDSETEIQIRYGGKISFSELKVGYKVRCEVTTLDRGTALASEIKVLDMRMDNLKIDVFGEVTQVLADGQMPDTLKVDHEFYEVYPQTEIIGFHGEPLGLADLMPGEDLQLKVRTRKNRLPQVEKIYRVVNRNLPMIARGRITEITSDRLSLSGLNLSMDDFTIALNVNKDFIDRSRLQEGVRVEILAEPGGQGLYANTVLLLSESLGQVVVTDVIRAIEQDRIHVGDFIFQVNENTRFLDALGQTVGMEFFENGDLVQVRGVHLNNDQYQAEEIQQRSLKQDEVTLRGTIAAINNNRMEIENSSIQLTDETRYFLEDGSETGDRSPFFPGRIVEVLARVSDGQKFARKVALVNQLDEELILVGPVDAIGSDWLKIANETIQLSVVSELQDENGAAVPLSAFRIGDRVEARTKILPAGGLFGWQIRRLIQPNDTVTVEGPVDQLQSGQVRVNGLAFLADAQTSVIDARGNAITLSALQNGWLIRVDARRIGSLYLASRIRVLSRFQYSGTLEAISSDQATITQTTFQFADNILVLNTLGAPVPVDSLSTGDQVQSVSEWSDGVPVIRRIRILSKRYVTGIESADNAPGVPRSFAVWPSYPNPITRGRINSEGNILRFRLNRPERVSVAVYNLLGQRIRNLVVDQWMAAGEHQVRWDGRAASGTSVAAGVYFYQTTIGTQRFIRKVLILP